MHSELVILKITLKIDFISKPINNYTPQMAHSAEESKIILEEIAKLLKKGVIKECDREKEDFISTAFTRRKKDGSMRTILNLKQLNKNVT